MKKRKIWRTSLTVFLTVMILLAAIALVLRPKTLDIGMVDLSNVADGAYIGICQNKILLAVVKVEVQNHQMTDIEILAHKESYRKQAEMIADAVLSGQSLKVDAVSGATLTSDTVLKAIENALSQGRE